MCEICRPNNYLTPGDAERSGCGVCVCVSVCVCVCRRQDSNSSPRLLILPLTLTCLLHMVRLLSAFPVMPCSRLLVPPMWEHTLYAQLLAPKEVLVPPLREPTILLVLILVQEQVLFLNHGHWFFPWSNLGNPSLTGLVTFTQSTAISCIINTVSLCPSVESRPGAQKSYQPCLRSLWKVSCGYSSRSQ